MAASATLYERFVDITETYLGPASERFIDRQIANHLHIEPHQLTATHVPDLIQWIRVTISVLTEDADLVDSYVAELDDLARQGHTS